MTKTDYTPVIPDRPDPVELSRDALPEDPHEEAYEYRQAGGPAFSDGTIPTPGTVYDPLMYVEPDPAETPEPGDTLQLGELGAIRAQDDLREHTGVIGRGASGRGGAEARRGRSGARTIDDDVVQVDDIGRFSGPDKNKAPEVDDADIDDDSDDGYDPADYSVDEVNEYIRENPEYAAEIAELERSGKGRKGILDHIG